MSFFHGPVGEKKGGERQVALRYIFAIIYRLAIKIDGHENINNSYSSFSLALPKELHSWKGSRSSEENDGKLCERKKWQTLCYTAKK